MFSHTVLLGSPQGAHCFVFGDPGAGRSWLATQLAADFQGGTNSLGLAGDSLSLKKPLKTLFVPLRDPVELAKARFDSLAANIPAAADVTVFSETDVRQTLPGIIGFFDALVVDDFDLLHSGDLYSANTELIWLIQTARRHNVFLFVTGAVTLAEEAIPVAAEGDLWVPWQIFAAQNLSIVLNLGFHEKFENYRKLYVTKNSYAKFRKTLQTFTFSVNAHGRLARPSVVVAK